MKHIFVINPNAGKGYDTQKIRNEVAKLSEKYCFNYDFIQCFEKEEAHKEIKEYLNEKERVRFYACGGDGTFSFCANCIYGHQNAELAMLPMGTGNDFPRSFESRELFSDIEAQLNGTPIKIDAIMCNGTLALNLLNIGFDAEVVRETDKIKKFPLFSGTVAYILGVVKCLLGMPTAKLEITLPDGEVLSEELLLFVAANASYYGGGFKPASSAVIDDGLADILIVRKVSRLKFIKLVSKYKNGSITETKDFEKVGNFLRCRAVKLKSEKEFLLCRDGELEFSEYADIEVIPNALTFNLPKGCYPINGLAQQNEVQKPYNDPSPVHKS